MIEPPDPAVAARIRARRAKGEDVSRMLAEHCRFTHKESGAEFKQRRIGDRTACATFTVTRTDGSAKTFHHGSHDYEAAYDFAVAESVPLRGDDHPLMQAVAAERS